MDLAQYALNTEIGTVYLVASKKGLKSVLFCKQSVPMLSKLGLSNEVEKNLSIAATQLEEYLKGKRKNFELKLDVEGTPFQRLVWKELAKIPFGKTLSYKDVAKGIANPKAVRAVGTANGRNPLCIIVPCHRVIAANGTLGGYIAGLGVKKKLLDLESANAL